jgi:hypothetical protein
MPDEQLAGQETPVVNNEAPEAVAENAAPAEQKPVEPGEKQEQVTKTFTQKDVDEIVKRAKAATESKTERRILRTLEQLQSRQISQPEPVEQPQSVRFSGESEEAYLERLVEEKLQQRTKLESLRSVAQKTDDFYAKAEKMAGFDREVFDSLPLTPAIAQTLVDSDPDTAPKIMAYLCENPSEVERISKLSAARQAAELGKLEDRLTASAKPKATPPKAPAPIDPIGSGKAPVTDMSRMSAEEYYQARMKQKPVWRR